MTDRIKITELPRTTALNPSDLIPVVRNNVTSAVTIGSLIEEIGNTGTEYIAGDGIIITNDIISNSDTGSAQTIFKRIGNSSGQLQFQALSNNDMLRFSGSGDTVVSFNSETNTVVISSESGEVYSAGIGVSINQNNEISNTDRGSSQHIFKRVADNNGAVQFSASSNDDVIRFAGSGSSTVSFNQSTKTITIDSQGEQYSAGSGISINSQNQISNSDRGSSQNIFKRIANSSGTTQITAQNNNDQLRIRGTGTSTVSFDPTVNMITINSTGGTYTASTGIGINQNNEILNTDRGSSQNIFKNIASLDGAVQFSANSNNDTIRFRATGGASVNFNSLTNTVTFNANTALEYTAGSGITIDNDNVIINTDRGSSQNIFKRVGDVFGNYQFESTTNDDMIRFAGIGGATVSFNPSSKTITFNSNSVQYSAGTGITISSGNQITNSDRGSSQSIFKWIGNSSGIQQFGASTNNDMVRFAATGGATISFSSSTKTVTIGANTGPTYTAGTGITFSTGNQISNSDGGSSQNIFKRIGNSTGNLQFSADNNNDMIRFAGTGGVSISFNTSSKTITIDGSGSASLGQDLDRLDQTGNSRGTNAVNLQTGRTSTANRASALNSIAIGYNTTSTSSGNVALGSGARATHTSSVAIGENSVSERSDSVNLGDRHLELSGSGRGLFLKTPSGQVNFLGLDSNARFYNSVQSSDVYNMVKLTQSQYDSLSVKNPNTLYIIVL